MGSPRVYPWVDSILYPGVDPGGYQNLPLPPRIYPLFVIWLGVFGSQNLPLLSRIYPPPFQQIYMCDPPGIYPSLPPRIHSTPLFNNYIMQPSQNVPLHPRIYPPFQQIYMCDPPRIYTSLTE